MANTTKTERLIRVLDKAGAAIEMSTGFVCATLLGILVAVMAMGVAFRYLLNDPIQWGEEISRYLMLWTGFAAMNIAMRRNSHIRIDIVVKRLPPRLEKIIEYLVYLLVGYFLMILFVKGYGMAVSTRMSVAAVPISMTWIYASVPLGALLTMIQLLLNIIMKVLSDLNPRKHSI